MSKDDDIVSKGLNPIDAEAFWRIATRADQTLQRAKRGPGRLKRGESSTRRIATDLLMECALRHLPLPSSLTALSVHAIGAPAAQPSLNRKGRQAAKAEVALGAHLRGLEIIFPKSIAVASQVSTTDSTVVRWRKLVAYREEVLKLLIVNGGR